jgi:hypothetical protein
MDYECDVLSSLMANGESRAEAEEEMYGLRCAEIESDYNGYDWGFNDTSSRSIS